MSCPSISITHPGPSTHQVVLDLSNLQPDASTGYTKRHYTVGLIKYPGRPGLGLPQETGYVLYIKQCMTGSEMMVDVWNQRARTSTSRFPNDPTSNQFFSEAQFEAYRALGYHIMKGINADAHRYMNLSGGGAHSMEDESVVNPSMQTWFQALLRCCAEDGDILTGTSVTVSQAREGIRLEQAFSESDLRAAGRHRRGNSFGQGLGQGGQAAPPEAQV